MRRLLIAIAAASVLLSTPLAQTAGAASSETQAAQTQTQTAPVTEDFSAHRWHHHHYWGWRHRHYWGWHRHWGWRHRHWHHW